MKRTDKKKNISRVNIINEARYRANVDESFDFAAWEREFHDKNDYEEEMSSSVGPEELEVGKTYQYRGKNTNTDEPLTGELEFVGTHENHPHIFNFKVIKWDNGSSGTSFSTSAENVSKHIYNM